MIELPGVIEDGMSGRNGERKPGTTRGSPRRSRTAKASRISRHAVKSRCACGWGGWGRLSDDGPGQHNPDPSEGPWGGGDPPSKAVHDRVLGPTLRGITEADHEVQEPRTQTIHRPVHAGSRLKLVMFGKALRDTPAFQPYRGKPAVRNDRGDRGNVGIIRSPVRASILPDLRGALSNERPYRESFASMEPSSYRRLSVCRANSVCTSCRQRPDS